MSKNIPASLQIHWLLSTNAKTEKNAEVLFNKVSRYFEQAPKILSIEGDRYSGQQIRFVSEHPQECREKSFYNFLMTAEALANSWMISRVSAPASEWSQRARIAGIQRIEWCEANSDMID